MLGTNFIQTIDNERSIDQDELSHILECLPHVESTQLTYFIPANKRGCVAILVVDGSSFAGWKQPGMCVSDFPYTPESWLCSLTKIIFNSP